MDKKRTASKIALFFSGIILGTGVAYAPPIHETFYEFIHPTSEFLPLSHPVIARRAYALVYDGKTRNASWVYEKLTAASLQKIGSREEIEFMEDPWVSSHITNADFKGSGFDRGHLCPAEDARANQEALKETFYLSNVSPQHPQFNRVYWLKLEKYARKLTKLYETVHVTTGPLFLPTEEEYGKLYVKYQVIGEGHVAVPTHYFKVIQGVTNNITETQAFIIPHKPIAKDTPLSDFAVPLSEVERASGILFHH